MQQGKKLTYNYKWFSENCGESELTNVCSPLAFSCLFNHDWFIGYAKTRSLKEGMSINHENNMIDRFFSFKGYEKSTQQYTVFETNGKFILNYNILKDVFSDQPEREEDCYIYYLYVLSKRGYHKIILINTTENFYLIDSNLSNVQVYNNIEFLDSILTEMNITNLSVLFHPLSNKWMSYKKQDFSHLI